MRRIATLAKGGAEASARRRRTESRTGPARRRSWRGGGELAMVKGLAAAAVLAAIALAIWTLWSFRDEEAQARRTVQMTAARALAGSALAKAPANDPTAGGGPARVEARALTGTDIPR